MTRKPKGSQCDHCSLLIVLLLKKGRYVRLEHIAPANSYLGNFTTHGRSIA